MSVLRSTLIAASILFFVADARAQGTASPVGPPSSPPAAASENRALAETLFFTARGLMEAERYGEACRKLEESYRLDPASGTLLNLALCHEKEGKVASAWGEYRQSLVEARRAGKKDREDICVERVAALQPLLPQLQIDVPEEARVAGLIVSRNGVDLSSAAWGTPLPTDPGTVEIVARAPGRKPWKTSVTIVLRGKETIAIEPLAIDDPPPTPDPKIVYANTGWPAKKTLGLVGMIAGAVAIGTGAVLGQIALDKRDESDNACPVRDDERRCTEQGSRLSSSANAFAWGSNLGIGLGAVALVGGGILFFTSSSSTSATTARIAPSLGGARLNVTF